MPAKLAYTSPLREKAASRTREAMRDAAAHPHPLQPRPRYPLTETSDLLWLWFGPHGLRTLVSGAGWSWERAETVIREAAIAALYDER